MLFLVLAFNHLSLTLYCKVQYPEVGRRDTDPLSYCSSKYQQPKIWWNWNLIDPGKMRKAHLVIFSPKHGKADIFIFSSLNQGCMPYARLSFEKQSMATHMTHVYYNRRGGGGPVYDKEFSKIDAHIYSFFPQSTAVWNNLPLQVRMSKDLSIVKKQMKNIELIN